MGEIGSGAGSSYPGALDTDNTVEVNSPNAGKTKARAEVPNDLAACIVAIENELGTDPAGTATDVKTRLDNEHGADGTHSKDFTHPLKWTESGDEYIRCPRLTTTQRDALSALDGMLIYNDTLDLFQIYHDAAWQDIIDSNSVVNNVRDVSRGLIISNPTAATIDVDANEVVSQDTSNRSVRLTSINLTIDITASGANGLDTGSEASSTWYYIWVIHDKDTPATAGLLSTSSTAPTMPSGYTYKALVGAAYNDASSNIVDFYQEGNKVEYNAIQDIKTASFTSSSWTAQSVTAFFPTTAKLIKLAFAVNAGVAGALGLSPRSDGHAGQYFHFSNPVSSTDFGGIFSAAKGNRASFEIRYASSIYYFINSAGGLLSAIGWEY